MPFARLGEWWKRWEVLFGRLFGGGVSRVGYENSASQFWILFGNVALDSYAHMAMRVPLSRPPTIRGRGTI